MIFEITEEQRERISKWLKELKPELVKLSKDPLGQEGPYYGPIGGGLTYSFTPTSVGMGVEVTEAVTKKSIDLTEWELW